MAVKKLVLMMTVVAMWTSAAAQLKIKLADVDTIYHPSISGTVRGKFEYQTEEGESRFMVRNARLAVSGNVVKMVSYKAEIDLCDEGSIKMLDAYVRVSPLKNGRFTIGQFRVPFTIDAHRSPHTQYFANRSFIAKQAGNIRDVGAAIGYTFPLAMPITIEAGIFNGSGLTGQKDYWTNRVNYSAKLQFKPLSDIAIVLSTQSISPNKKPVYMHDAGVSLTPGRWLLEAEYLYKHYKNNAFKDAHAVNAMVGYFIPVNKAVRTISLLGRYDMLTDHSNGTLDENGNMTLTDSKRHRATAGVTLSLGSKFQSDIRVNFEKYFYPDNAIVKPSEKDKLVVEFMVHF